MYFPDEIVSVNLAIDNRASQRRIQNITCFLRQTVSVMKDKQDESKGSYWQKKFDLHRVVISKASFDEMISKKKSQSINTKRVHGKFLVQMNLK